MTDLTAWPHCMHTGKVAKAEDIKNYVLEVVVLAHHTGLHVSKENYCFYDHKYPQGKFIATIDPYKNTFLRTM